MRSEDLILLTHHQSFSGEGQPVAISVTGSNYWVLACIYSTNAYCTITCAR